MSWFTSPSGVTCVGAWDAIGASSLADSYTNEAGGAPCAPGVAPTWAAGTGWGFAGASWLNTGLTPLLTWSMIVRFSGAGGVGYHAGTNVTTRFTMIGGYSRYGVGTNFRDVARGATSGVACIASYNCYWNGAADGAVVAAGADPTGAIWIGCRHVAGDVPGDLYTGNIAALAIYSGTLTAADVLAITTAMNALPTAATAPMMMQFQAELLAGRW